MRKVKKKVSDDDLSHQFPSKPDHMRNMSDAALTLSLQEEHSDIIFYCEGTNNVVFAHKAMFFGRSDFLTSLFAINSQQLYPAAKAHIYLPTVRKTALTNVIKYLYQGEAVLETVDEKNELIELIKILGIAIDSDCHQQSSSGEPSVQMSQEVTAPTTDNSRLINVTRSEQNIDLNSTNEVVKALADFTEELMMGMTRAYYERAKRLAGNDQSRVNILNLSSNITEIAAMGNKDSVAHKEIVENVNKEFVPEDRQDAPTNKKNSRGRPSRRNKEADGQKETPAKENDNKSNRLPSSRNSSNKKTVVESETEDGNAVDSSVNDIGPVAVDLNKIESQEKGSLRRKRKASDVQEKDGADKQAEMNGATSLNDRPEKKRGRTMKVTPEKEIIEEGIKEREPAPNENGNSCNKDDSKESLQNTEEKKSEPDVKTNVLPKMRGRKGVKVDHVIEETSPHSSKKADKKVESDISDTVVERKRRGRKSIQLQEENKKVNEGNSLKENKNIREKQDENDESKTKSKREENNFKEQNTESDLTENNESEEEEYEVEKILAKKGSGRKLVYLVKWKGYDKDEDNTWEPAKNLHQSIYLITEFEKSQKLAKTAKSETIPAEKKTPTRGRGKSKASVETDSNVKKDVTDKGETDIVEDETTMCDLCTRIFLTAGAMSVHMKEEHYVDNEEDISPIKDNVDSKKDHSVSFSDSEDEVGKVKKVVGATFDDLFGGNDNDDIASGLVNDENIKSFIYNKDSDDESDDGKKRDAGPKKGDNLIEGEQQDDKKEEIANKDGDEVKTDGVDVTSEENDEKSAAEGSSNLLAD